MNEKNNKSKNGYADVLPFRSPNANYNAGGAGYQRPIGQGMAPDGSKHCATCQCAAHSQGGLENKLYGALGGMQGSQPQISININYFVTPDMLGAYGQEGNYGAEQGKLLQYGKKKDNDSYGKERNYDRKAA